MQKKTIIVLVLALIVAVVVFKACQKNKVAEAPTATTEMTAPAATTEAPAATTEAATPAEAQPAEMSKAVTEEVKQ